MVWGCMGWEGVGRLTEVEGEINADQYVSILEDNLLPSLEESGFFAENVTFQHSQHTSIKATKWFEDNDINVLDWAPQSPHINPIEYLWQHIKLWPPVTPTQPALLGLLSYGDCMSN